MFAPAVTVRPVGSSSHEPSDGGEHGMTIDEISQYGRVRAGYDGRGVASSPLIEILERVHAAFAPVADGDLATYIPELARADPHRFGIAIATVDGEVFEIGAAADAFTIQSISKPLVFGMALEDRGHDTLLRYVGVEPSGNPFNAIAVEPETSRPYNPMVNAGAIVTTSLVSGADTSERLERVRELFGVFAGRDLAIDARVHDSERQTGDRNRALAWLMRSFGKLHGDDVEQILDLYFGQCSVLVTARDLAVMGATLANEGENPITGARAISPQHVANVLSVMATCGMYDNAGEWVYNVGLPAKSGVAGGLLAVLPGQLGIGVFSPPLDSRGNSVRGIGVCERLSRELNLHLLSPISGVRSIVRRVVRGDEVASNRVRTVSEEEAIAARRRSIALYELQGDLFFATAEKVHRTVVADFDDVEFVVLDFRHVGHVDAPALAVINGLAETLEQAGRTVVAVYVDPEIGAKLTASVSTFLDTDAALEWCEDRLLDASDYVSHRVAPATLDEFDLLSGLTDAELAALELAVDVRTLEAGCVIFREGDVADAMFFLLSGRVSVLLPLDAAATGRSRRLATFSAGVAFGEMALLDEGERSADVMCDERATVAALSLAAVRHLDAEHPTIGPKLHANLARLLARRLRTANAQIRALAR
jgi:glutaminase